MFHVAFYGFDKVRYQIVTSGKLYIDLGKRVFDAVTKIDEFIVDTDDVSDQRDDYREEYQK